MKLGKRRKGRKEEEGKCEGRDEGGLEGREGKERR